MPTTRIDEDIYRIIYINSLSANPINFGRIQSMTSITSNEWASFLEMSEGFRGPSNFLTLFSLFVV